MALNAVHRCFHQRRTGNIERIDHIYEDSHVENQRFKLLSSKGYNETILLSFFILKFETIRISNLVHNENTKHTYCPSFK